MVRAGAGKLNGKVSLGGVAEELVAEEFGDDITTEAEEGNE